MADKASGKFEYFAWVFETSLYHTSTHPCTGVKNLKVLTPKMYAKKLTFDTL